MRSYPWCSAILLMQVLGSVLLSQCFCNCFQITTTISSDRHCVGCEESSALAQSLSPPLPTPTTETTEPRMKTKICSSLSSSFDSMDRFEDKKDNDTSPPEYTVTIHYENRSCDIQARSDETILSALERNQLILERLGLPNSMIPSDCRRGNCLTCTGTHASVSSRLASGTAVVCDGDGLSPHLSRTIQEKGYILTCSTRVVGEGLQLNLGENHKVWEDVYQRRFEKEPSQSAKWAAMAQSKRRSDERKRRSDKTRWEQNMKDLLEEENIDDDGDDKSVQTRK